MKVVSVINYKGGVGKTTLVSNLAAYAASQGKRVLMIDLDPQMSLTLSFMDMDTWEKFYANTPNKTLKDFFSAVLEGETPPDLSELADNFGKFKNGGRLNLISSHIDLIDVDVALIESIASAKPEIFAKKFLKCYNQLRIALAKVKDNYDLVMLDCPPNFYALVKNAITASDYYIIPSKMDYLSEQGVERLQSSLAKYRGEYRANLNIYNASKSARTPEYAAINIIESGIVPTMVEVWRGNQLKANCSRFYSHLQDKKYHLFQWIRDNSNFFGVDSVKAGPAVLRKSKEATAAHQTIITELQVLGDDFMKRAGI